MRYVVTFRDGKKYRWKFKQRSRSYHLRNVIDYPMMAEHVRDFHVFQSLRWLVDKMDWIDNQPFGRALKQSGIPYAHVDSPPSSIIITRDLTDDEIVLLTMAGSDDIAIRDEDEFPLRKTSVEKSLREPDRYARPLKPREPYPVVKRVKK